MSESPSFLARMRNLVGYIFFSIIGVFGSIILIGIIFSVGIASLAGSHEKAEMSHNKTVFDTIYGDDKSQNVFLSIPVHGVIMGSKSSHDIPFFMEDVGIAYGYEIKQQLMDAATDKDIKGILLDVSTPGGTIFGSQAISDGITYYREKSGRPVVVYIQGLAASGGIWSIVKADAIYADYGSMIGSIGVIGPTLQYFNGPVAIDGGVFSGGVTTTGGIETFTVSSGRHKDIGNPFRKPTDEELAVLQKGTDAAYNQFVKHVSEARKITPETIREQMGAMIFDNEQAQSYKLIDGTKTLDESMEELAKLAGVKDVKDYNLMQEAPMKQQLRDLLGIFNNLPLFSAASAQRMELAAKAEKCKMASQPVLAYYGSLNLICK